MSPASLQHADAVLRDGYEAHRGEVTRAVSARLRARSVHVDGADLDGLYNQAWHALHSKLAEGEAVENVQGFLVQAIFFRSIDEYRRVGPARQAGPEPLETLTVEDDMAHGLAERDQLRHLIEALRERLNPRERQAAALCYLQGLTRPEAAEVLGLPERRMQKLMDGVSRKVAVLTEEISSGRWCESRDSLIKAYALGLLDREGERYAAAAAHLDDCSACRRRVLGLRGLAAACPPVLMPMALLAGGGASASTPRPRRPSTTTAVAAAAVFALVLGGTAVAVRSGGDGGAAPAPAPSASAPPAGAAPGGGGAAGGSGGGGSAGSGSAAATTDRAARKTASARARRVRRRAAARRATAARQRSSPPAPARSAPDTAPAPVVPANVAPAPVEPAPAPPAATPAPVAPAAPEARRPRPSAPVDAEQEFDLLP